MAEEGLLLGMIIERLASGLLPRTDCAVTWWGSGRGAPCAACGYPIRAEDIECECDLPDGPTIRFHARCFDVWQRARQS